MATFFCKTYSCACWLFLVAIISFYRSDETVGSTFDHDLNKVWERLAKEISNNREFRSSRFVVGTSSFSKAAPHAAAYATLTKNCALQKKIMSLFNRPCYYYLNGRHCGIICKWNHKLPSAHEIFRKLVQFSNDDIMYVYSNFISKSKMVFVTYFPIMCDLFGSRKMQSSLLNAVKDCDLCEKLAFYKCIYHGLVMTGLSKRDALTKIDDYCCKKRASYDILLEIIIETDPLYFIDMLNKFYRYGTISSHHMLKLCQYACDNPAPYMLRVFIDILDTYSMSDVCDVGTFRILLLRAENLAAGDINLSNKLNNIASRY